VSTAISKLLAGSSPVHGSTILRERLDEAFEA
jgi:hypothetical protein